MAKLEFNEYRGWLGQYEIEIRDLGGKLIELVRLRPNLLMDSALNMQRDLLSGTITDGKIKYVGLGTGTTAPDNGQTQLVSEQYRKQVTSQTAGGVGVLTTTVYVPPDEANSFLCQEIGWFAGAAASAGVNTGTMIARVLHSRQKTALESWTIRRVDSIGRA